MWPNLQKTFYSSVLIKLPLHMKKEYFSKIIFCDRIRNHKAYYLEVSHFLGTRIFIAFTCLDIY